MASRQPMPQREAFAHRITAASGWPSGDPRLEAALRDTPRERFLPPGLPQALVYADTTINLGPPGINNGQPSLHAACLAALAPQPGETVAHVGAGTGYYTAILARLVGAHGRIEAFEIEPALARQARANLAALGLDQVRVHAASGVGVPLPPSDIVYVNCGASAPQPEWLDALSPGGRLLFPLTGADSAGAMLLITRPPQPPEADWPARFLAPVLFVNCGGARDPADVHAVTAAFARGGQQRVVALHRGPAPRLPARVWCARPSWWLERAPA